MRGKSFWLFSLQIHFCDQKTSEHPILFPPKVLKKGGNVIKIVKSIQHVKCGQNYEIWSKLRSMARLQYLIKNIKHQHHTVIVIVQ